MVEINGVQVELERHHRIKWSTEDGRKFWGIMWDNGFTPFGDLITVHPFRCDPEDMEQLISEEQILDVDPFIKWHPPVFSFGDEEDYVS